MKNAGGFRRGPDRKAGMADGECLYLPSPRRYLLPRCPRLPPASLGLVLLCVLGQWVS